MHGVLYGICHTMLLMTTHDWGGSDKDSMHADVIQKLTSKYKFHVSLQESYIS